MNRHIAIDGPGSSGKSTIAKILAARTGHVYVDTGAMFRAMAVCVTEEGIPASDEAAVTELVRKADITICPSPEGQRVIVDGRDVTPFLRREEVGQAASAISVYGGVREVMKELQQKLAAEKPVVMDGRDIGTVILPDAFLKIFMTASSKVRAERRCRELLAKGLPADFETVKAELDERDWRDTHREIAPLKQADDAIRLDTSYMEIGEVCARIMRLYEMKEAAWK